MSIAEDIEAALPALHRYARSLVAHRDDADDLVQDCLERAFRHPPAATPAGGLRPWLFTILHNLGVSRWRSVRRRGVTVAATEADLRVAPAQDWGLATRDLVRGFEDLSPEHRQVLLLVAVEGLEYRDAAAVLGVAVGTVMSRLSRARDALRAHMNGTAPVLRRVK